MTCLAAVETDRGVWLGCDSYHGDGTTYAALDRPKIFRVGPVALAWCGSLRVAQQVRFGQAWRGPRRGEDTERYMVEVVAQRLSAVGMEDDTTFLAVVRGQVWYVDSDCSMSRSLHGYAAAGVGAEYALGALAATPRIHAKDRVQRALEAAGRHGTPVAPPYHLQWIGR